MRYRSLIFKDYVAVRVGPEEVTFWAVCGREQEYTPLKITDMGVWIPGRFRTDTRNPDHRMIADHLRKKAMFV